MEPSESPSYSLSEAEFMRLFLKHELALRAFARSIVPNWDAVDDALQESSVTMWQKLDQLREESGFLPWAKVIVRYKCLSLVAKERKQYVFSPETLALIADEAESVSGEAVAEIYEALQTCLSDFSTAHQQLLLAPYSSNGMVQELAQQAGRSVNSLYKLLGRLRQKLRVCVAKKTQHGLA